IPYSLNAPHRFMIQADYKLNDRITLGAEFASRSGYSYTPVCSELDIYDDIKYNNDYYMGYIDITNSSQFPANSVINLHAEFKLGRFELYLNCLNVANRNNPIISTSNGLIYDAGILPSLGLKIR
ncbi:MAG: hypothetical protein GY839_09940, partial [candidate division Zixibacteria bacterium]|nr:hypothetical protein [candidate division Zixibacteria bacterium]